jgi:hypothetical protein
MMKIFNKKTFRSLLLPVLLIVRMVSPVTTMAEAQDTVNLGRTSGFAVLAGTAITNTGNTTINGSIGGSVGGDIGVSPGTAITGQASVTINSGAIQTVSVSSKAQDDLVTAYNDAAGRLPVTRIRTELGGSTLKPGTYDSADGTFQITGTLTLDAEGDPNAVFIFKTASTLITAAGSNVNLIHEARFCRTFWKVGSSATLGTNSNFVGHIFAMVSITANNGATVQGQLLARNGAVTLDNNTITNGFCEGIERGLATLTVIKKVINDNGGNKVASDFMLHIKTLGNDVVASPAPGNESGTTYTLDAGNYAISEDASTGYKASYSGDVDSNGNITLVSGDTKTITITNDDIAVDYTPSPVPQKATLRVIKHVINDDDGVAVAADFNLHVKTSGNDVATSPALGTESGTTYTLDAGTYVVSEDAFTGYTASYSGDGDSNGNITLATGQKKTITITNDDVSAITPPIQKKATLHVIKHVTNDDGGTAIASNFNIKVKSFAGSYYSSTRPGNESGTTYTLDAGTYVISEDTFTGYTASFSGDSSKGIITLSPGDNKTVMITNNDILIVPVISPVITPVTTTPGVKKTVTGGQLPKTNTHLYEVIVYGTLLTIIGVRGWLSRKRYE